jgi:hypothetical protein
MEGKLVHVYGVHIQRHYEEVGSVQSAQRHRKHGKHLHLHLRALFREENARGDNRANDKDEVENMPEIEKRYLTGSSSLFKKPQKKVSHNIPPKA